MFFVWDIFAGGFTQLSFYNVKGWDSEPEQRCDIDGKGS